MIAETAVQKSVAVEQWGNGEVCSELWETDECNRWQLPLWAWIQLLGAAE